MTFTLGDVMESRHTARMLTDPAYRRTFESDKLKKLAELEGGLMEMLEEATFDVMAWGICMNEGCDYTTQVEPDQGGGWCEECQQGTVKSCLLLAGMI